MKENLKKTVLTFYIFKLFLNILCMFYKCVCSDMLAQ